MENKRIKEQRWRMNKKRIEIENGKIKEDRRRMKGLKSRDGE